MSEIRGTVPGAQARLQARVSAKEIAGKEVSIEVNAPERADHKLMLHELSEQVEKGLVERYVREEVWNRVDNDGNSVWIEDFNRDFEQKKESIYKTLITQRELGEWKESTQEQINLLRELQDIINRQDADAMLSMRGSLNLMGGGRRGDVGYEASQQLAEIFKRVAKQQQITEDSRRAASDAIEKLIRQQLGVEEALAGANPTTRWVDLTPEAQAHVWRFYLNLRWKGELGTIRRSAEFKVLTRRRDTNGRRAPWKVMPGADRQVYEAILAWRALNEKLKAEDDPEKRAAIQAEMDEREKFVGEWTSNLTATHDGRMETGPVGVSQVKQGAWEEIRHTIDLLREGDKWQQGIGQVKKTFVFAGATYDQSSWEAVDLKTRIFYQFGAAKNALKRLDAIAQLPQTERDQQLRQLFTVTGRPDARDRVKKEMETQLRELRNQRDTIEGEIRKVQSKVREAHSEVTSLQDQLNEANRIRTSLEAAGYGPGSTSGGNQQRRTSGQSVDDYTAAIRRIQSLETSVSQAQQRERDAQAQLNELRADPTSATPGAPGKLDRVITAIQDLERQIQAGGDPGLVQKYEQENDEARQKHISTLREKLVKFVTQSTLENEFETLFDNNDVQAIGNLTGLGSHEDTRHKKWLLSDPSLANTGDIENQDGVVTFSGDYAFINASALPGQAGRLSPDILQQMLDNVEAYPELKKLVDRLQEENKIVIVTSFTVSNDVDGGMIEKSISQAGRQFDFEAAEQLKKQNKWTDKQLFEHWLDDLNIQRLLGVRPEEVEARYARWIAKNHHLRQTHFNAKDGWTFINTSVSTSTPMFFETMIRRMVDAGVDLTSEGYRMAPFYQQAGQTNEYTYTITDKDLTRKVKFRGEELTVNPEAPKTIVKRVYMSLMKELELYYNRSMMGGQATSNAEWMTEDDIMKLGAFVDANLALIQKKMITLRSIYSELEVENPDPNVPPVDPNTVLQKMIDWSEGRLTREVDGTIERDPGMVNLTYDILDENGNFIEESHNSELWLEFNGTSQYLGKLKRDLREMEKLYANTVVNPNTPPEELEYIEQEYYKALNARRTFEVRQYALGMQAAGRMAEMDNKEVGRVFSNRYAKITSNAILRLQERKMRAVFEYENDVRSIGNPKNVAKRLVGRLAKSRVGEWARSMGNTIGIGDRFLREVDQHVIAEQIRDKMDTEIVRRLSAHIAHSIETGYQREWSGVFHPESSDLLFGPDDVRGIDGIPITDDIDAPSAQLSPTGERYLKALELRIRDDISDAVDRTILNNRHIMIKAGKKRGWNIDEIMVNGFNARMNDKADIEDRPGGGVQYNMYGRLDFEEPYTRQPDGTLRPKYDATPVSMVERWLWDETHARMRRSNAHNNNWNLLRIQRAPRDTQAVHPRHNIPSVAAQHRNAQARGHEDAVNNQGRD